MADRGAEVDVAVVGAGPAGAATARWLAQAGARVALIERSRFDEPRFGESLAPAVQPALQQLGLWPDFVALAALPSYGTRSCWGEATPQSHSHLASPWGCGWHVDRAAFDRLLAQGACRAGARPWFGQSLADGHADGTGWELSLAARQPGGPRQALRARLLVDASGRAARCAGWLGARRQPLDRLVAVARRYACRQPHEGGHVLVESVAEGWWYSAPLPGAGLVAMLFTDGDLAGRQGLQQAAAWQAGLQRAPQTLARVADAQPLDDEPRRVFAGSHRLARQAARPPWLAVGDATLAVDPVSGSGIVRALATAFDGAQAALAALQGNTDAIPAYEARRDAEFTRYVAERAAYYGVERRFASQPFWARRTGPGRPERDTT